MPPMRAASRWPIAETCRSPTLYGHRAHARLPLPGAQRQQDTAPAALAGAPTRGIDRLDNCAQGAAGSIRGSPFADLTRDSGASRTHSIRSRSTYGLSSPLSPSRTRRLSRLPREQYAGVSSSALRGSGSVVADATLIGLGERSRGRARTGTTARPKGSFRRSNMDRRCKALRRGRRVAKPWVRDSQAMHIPASSMSSTPCPQPALSSERLALRKVWSTSRSRSSRRRILL